MFLLLYSVICFSFWNQIAALGLVLGVYFEPCILFLRTKVYISFFNIFSGMDERKYFGTFGVMGLIVVILLIFSSAATITYGYSSHSNTPSVPPVSSPIAEPTPIDNSAQQNIPSEPVVATPPEDDSLKDLISPANAVEEALPPEPALEPNRAHLEASPKNDAFAGRAMTSEEVIKSEVSVEEGQDVVFNAIESITGLEEDHNLKVLNLTEDSATFEVRSEPQLATLHVLASQEFDLDGDLKNDLRVTLRSITLTSHHADFLLESFPVSKDSIVVDSSWLVVVIGVVVLLIVILILWLSRRSRIINSRGMVSDLGEESQMSQASMESLVPIMSSIPVESGYVETVPGVPYHDSVIGKSKVSQKKQSTKPKKTLSKVKIGTGRRLFSTMQKYTGTLKKVKKRK